MPSIVPLVQQALFAGDFHVATQSAAYRGPAFSHAWAMLSLSKMTTKPMKQRIQSANLLKLEPEAAARDHSAPGNSESHPPAFTSKFLYIAITAFLLLLLSTVLILQTLSLAHASKSASSASPVASLIARLYRRVSRQICVSSLMWEACMVIRAC